MIARITPKGGFVEPVRVRVTKSKQINAITLPGGEVLVFDGLIQASQSPEELAGVIAHEFGHALQARTGILISAKALGQNSNDEKTDLLYSRRLETQADCFSGMYIRSVSQSLGINQSDLAGIEDTYKAVGDDSVTGDSTVLGNHGLARSRVFWGDAGIGNAQISACNTFTAPANQVR